MNSALSKTWSFPFTLPHLHSQIFSQCHEHMRNMETPVRQTIVLALMELIFSYSESKRQTITM